MQTRTFGQTGLVVPALGLGAGPLGDLRISDLEAERLVHAALDLGVTLLDTARSYGASEERIGRALRGRPGQAVISTKVGYGIAGTPDWTAEAVKRGVDEALGKLGVDVIDIVHLHSCPADVLARGEVSGALASLRAAGKIRVAAYSGDDEPLARAVESGAFGSIEMSVSPWDQGGIDRVLWKAKERGMGAIAKRPLANVWWTHERRPERPDIAAYWDRGHALQLPDFGLDRAALSLRFAVFTWGVDCAIAGTTSEAHLRDLAKIVEDGPLPEEAVRALREAWWQGGATLPSIV